MEYLNTSQETMNEVEKLQTFLLKKIAEAGEHITIAIGVGEVGRLLVNINNQISNDRYILNVEFEIDYQQSLRFEEARSLIIRNRVQQLMEDLQGCQCERCGDALKHLTAPLIKPFEPKKTHERNRH